MSASDEQSSAGGALRWLDSGKDRGLLQAALPVCDNGTERVGADRVMLGHELRPENEVQPIRLLRIHFSSPWLREKVSFYVDLFIGGRSIGWHTFRHTYRSWLDAADAPLSMQRELMRHASIQTTMNVYGRATMSDAKRQANSKVVRMAMKPMVTQETTGSSA